MAGYNIEVADVYLDGTADVLVGAVWGQLQDPEFATWYPPGAASLGRVYVVDPAGNGDLDDEAVTTLVGGERSYMDGYAVGMWAVGDVTADGLPDVVVVSTEVYPTIGQYGTHLYSGLVPGVMERNTAVATIEELSDLALDLDGDGGTELAVGSVGLGPGALAGAVFLLHEPTGTIDLMSDAEASLTGAAPTMPGSEGGLAGARVHGGLDLDGDGAPDLYLPAERGYVVTTGVGASGPLADVAWASFEPDERSARSVRPTWGDEAALGDYDGDGAVDLALSLVSAAGGTISDPWTAHVATDEVALFLGPVGPGSFRGEDAVLVLQGDGGHEDGFGMDLEALDLDFDGRADLIVGAPFDSTRAPVGGAAYLFTGGGLASGARRCR